MRLFEAYLFSRILCVSPTPFVRDRLITASAYNKRQAASREYLPTEPLCNLGDSAT